MKEIGPFSIPLKFASQPTNWILVPICYPLLERNNRVVRDVDIFWTDFSAALRDIAVADARVFARQLQTIHGVQRMHVELSEADEEPWPSEVVLVLLMITYHV